MPNEIYHRSNFGNPNAEGFGDVYYDHAATNKLYNHSDYYENSDGTDATLKDLNNKASIVLTPTAYSDGSLNTVIPPYQVFEERVVNGDFRDGTNNWQGNYNTTLSVSNGQLDIQSISASGKYGVAFSEVNFVEGKKYLIKLDVISTDRPTHIRVGTSSTVTTGTPQDIFASGDIGIGSHEKIYTATGNFTYLSIGGRNDMTTLVIDNVSVREVTVADFDFSRGSSATRVNEQGLVEDSQGDDYPRIDFTDGTGSLLLEPQRTNAIIYSEDFTQSVWTLLGAGTGVAPIVTSNYAISPDGTQNATRLQFNLNGGTTTLDRSHIRYSSFSSQTDYYYSCYIKSANNENQKILWQHGGDSDEFTVTTEWQRVEFNRNGFAETFAGFSLRGGISTVDVSDVLIWGFQVEQGSSPTSYIVSNSGSTTTRSADVANNSGNADLFNDSEGVLYAEIAALSNDGTNRAIAISDGTTSNVVRFYYSVTDNRIVGNVKSSGSTVFSYNNVLTDATDFIKVAVSYKANDFKMYVDGVQVSTDTSGAVPTGLVELAFDNGASADDFLGKTKAVAVFKEALSNDLLERLTGEGYESFRLLAEANNYTII